MTLRPYTLESAVSSVGRGGLVFSVVDYPEQLLGKLVGSQRRNVCISAGVLVYYGLVYGRFPLVG